MVRPAWRFTPLLPGAQRCHHRSFDVVWCAIRHFDPTILSDWQSASHARNPATKLPKTHRVMLHCLGIISWAAAILPSSTPAPDVAASSPIRLETRRFLGFSSNERLAAWRLEVTSQQPHGAVDTYALAHLVDTYSGDVAAVFRATPIRRRGAAGERAQLLRDHPEYARAKPMAQWRRLKKRVRFRFGRLRMDDSTVRLAETRAYPMQMTAEKFHIAVQGAAGQGLAFQPIARLYDGSLVPLGEFRARGRAGQRLEARVRVYFSPTGYHLAVLTRIRALRGERVAHTDLATVVPTRSAPVATLDIGGIQAAKAEADLAERLFARQHPDSIPLYQRWVPSW